MTSTVQLREVIDSDLPIFFEQQADPEARYMAGYTSGDPTDRDAFMASWARNRTAPTVIARTILYDGQVAGNVSSFILLGQRAVGYWIGKPFWGKGIATAALAQLLEIETERPLFARVVKDNAASLRVLQKGGFRINGEDKGFANARGKEVEEWVLKLEPDAPSAPSGR